ncbi:MAG: FAD-dependent oxidoreductase [Chloroflexi bacterium]|nr:FAD-dependent oxidoreductase [Chloroflexota bacterium]
MTTDPRSPRLDPIPLELIDRSKTVEFEFNGRPVQAYEGDTVGSALYASGVRIFSRSFKYHRVRGMLCVSGNCPNCLMTVDGVPNVRACVQRVEQGMKVKGQNAWPGLERDLFSVIDRFRWALPVGFYYKGLYRPRALWNFSASLIRRLAGLGSVNLDAEEHRSKHRSYAHADVAVVGGGIAGMSAALEAAENGGRVTLVDDQPTLGGRLRYGSRHQLVNVDGGGDVTPPEAAYLLASRIAEHERIEVLSYSTVFGHYEGNLLGVRTPHGIVHLRGRHVVVATGAQEVPLTFERNDLSGVTLSTGIRRLINLYGVKPGNTALVVTTNDEAYYAALDMLEAGMRIVAVADTRPEYRSDLEAATILRSKGVLILPNYCMVRAEGTRTVIGGVVAEIGPDGMTGNERQFDCDTIAMSGGFQPSTALLHQAGATFMRDFDVDAEIPVKLPESVHVAGDVTAFHDPTISAMQGKLAGKEASLAVGALASDTKLSDLKHSLRESISAYRRRLLITPAPVDLAAGPRQFVCYCEDVLAKDVVQGVEEGFRDVQMLKRYSTVTMGPCQGKMCHKRFTEILASETDSTLTEVGSTTSRPPIQPLTLGELAGPMHMAFKRTPIHHRHLQANAKIAETGGWHRPHSYGDPLAEARAVRTSVGIIDVGTLGKLDIQGKDAPELLDFVYTHRFSDLRPGRVRYGVLTGDNGTIMDDGTVARLADDHYYVTTSTANVEAVEQWFQWWMADREMCAHVTNVTSGYSVINIAGPNARATLAKLTDIDLSPAKFRYMRVKSGDVAGVPTILLKIGFVGESGWEVHCPAEYGEHMWDTLLAAGDEFGIQPFGVEAQRILRLEKMHIIPSQDTDLLTTPFDVGADWVVKFDKGDFVGAGGLRLARDRGDRDKLVGFVMSNGVVPHDGDSVVDEANRPIGRITSSRLSPTMGKGFGYARVPAGLASEGKTIHIWAEGSPHDAKVTLSPFYDPEGKRLRE